jgi:hypothetical protein
MGCPREAEPAAGGEWRRWRSGVQGRKDRAGEDAVEDGGADGATGLGRERVEVRAPRWTELGGVNGGATLVGRVPRPELRGGRGLGSTGKYQGSLWRDQCGQWWPERGCPQ